jgi:hypothetical protein
MSSFYSDASIVLIPSGYKNQKIYCAKPTDGTGDLTFTRASSATRVASNGLIEQVRTNVVTYSQDFNDASWTKTALTISTSATANPLNGALTAQDAIPTAVSSVHRVLKLAGVVSTANTWSIYAKAKGYNFITIVENGNTSASVSFNLSTGAVSTQISAVGQIQSLGSGWFRCSMIHTTTSTPRFDVYVSPTDSQAAYTADGTSGVTLFGAQAEASDFGATDYIPTTTAAVSVGPVSGLPRLDYYDSTCPKLLLEPQRTNLVTFSENLDNDAVWAKVNVTVTANTTTSPDGTISADTVLASGAAGLHLAQTNGTSYTSGTAASFTVFAKKGTNDFMQLITGAGVGGMFANFDLNTGVVGTLGTVTGTTPTSSIQDYGNGWYRCAINFTPNATASALNTIAIVTSASAARAESNSLATSIFLWGAQVEAGAYPTSYIPTLGASVTRVADAASKTGISSLIGQTEGTIFVEGAITGSLPAITRRIVSLSDGTTSNAVLIQNSSSTTLQFVIVDGGTIEASITKTLAFTFGQTFKVAFAYKENDFVAYINGEQVGTEILGNVPATSKFAFDRGNNTTAYEGTISQALVFKTRLTNDQLAELTA